MSIATVSKVTAEELEAIPDDGFQYELIEGVVRRMAPASFRPSNLAVRVTIRIGAYAEAHRLGEITGADGGYVLARDPDTVLAPDVAFVRADRLPSAAEQEHFPELAPDLVVEVISPSDRMKDVNEKVDRYLAAGVPLVWVFHPRQTNVTVHRRGRPVLTLEAGDVVDGEDILPGFQLPVADIFQMPSGR